MEWIDEVVCERIDVLLRERFASRQSDNEALKQALEQAEGILNRLSPEDWDAVDHFHNMVMEMNSEDSSYLYVCGFKDGIRAMKFVNKL